MGKFSDKRRDEDEDDDRPRKRPRDDDDEPRGKKKSKFGYERRSPEANNKRANQSGGQFDQMFSDTYPVFSPKAGDYTIRIIQATWDKAEHYGYDVWLHYQVGPDNNRYLCPRKHKGEDCAVCQEQERANREGEEKYAKECAPRRGVAVLLIDRSDEKKGPQIWRMPWKVDRDIAKLSVDKKSQEMLYVDDPEEGYDIEFTVSGKGLTTEYSGVAVARHASPLSDDDDKAEGWIEKVKENPLPDQLNFFDPEYIAKVFAGKGGKKDDDEDEKPRTRSERASSAKDDDEDDDRPRRKRPRDDDDEDEKPRAKKPARDEDDDLDAPEDERPKKRPRDDDEDERPAKPRARVRDEEEDEAPRRKRPRDDDDDDDEKPAKRPKRDEDDDEPRGKLKDEIRRGLRGRDDDEDERPKKPKRPADDDEEEAPRKKRPREDDDD